MIIQTVEIIAGIVLVVLALRDVFDRWWCPVTTVLPDGASGYFALSEITRSHWNLAIGFSPCPAMHGEGGLPSWQRPTLSVLHWITSCPIFIRRQVPDV